MSHLRTAILLTLIALPQASFADKGVFDFLDPCIAAKSDYWDRRDKMLAMFDTRVAAVATETPPPEFRDAWWSEKLKLFKSSYRTTGAAAVVKAAGGDVQAGFKAWLEKTLAAPEVKNAREEAVVTEYRRLRTLAFKRAQHASQAELDKQKEELYGECPSDLGSQVFQASVNVATAPIRIVAGNIKGAERESGAIAKGIRILGPSVKDIEKYGPLGGPNSVFNCPFGGC